MQTLYELIEKVGPPDWINEMHDFFNKHGYFRTEDLSRVLGSQTRGVSVPQNDKEVLKYFLESV